jgi:two-component system chemotaxis response regulator CheB
VAHRDIIVIGASAGGVQALQEICAGLPANLNAAVLVVMHISPQSGSFLAPVLNRAGPLKALNPLNGERIEKGKIYLAPPNRHMLVERSRFRIIGTAGEPSSPSHRSYLPFGSFGLR